MNKTARDIEIEEIIREHEEIHGKIIIGNIDFDVYLDELAEMQKLDFLHWCEENADMLSKLRLEYELREQEELDKELARINKIRKSCGALPLSKNPKNH